MATSIVSMLANRDAACRHAAAPSVQVAAVEMSPEFTDTSRAALAWVLWHHQGFSSEVGQAMRFALGMGRTDRLSEHQVAEARRWAALTSSPQASEAAAVPVAQAETLLPHAYLLAKCAMVVPLLEEARYAITAISEQQRLRHGISKTLADRMDIAGTYSVDDWRAAPGYIRISAKVGDKRRNVLAHRLAWFIVHGKTPVGQIDHINQNKRDNRVSNLRDVSRSANQRNSPRRRDNKSGVTGVSWSALGKRWCAEAKIGGKSHYIGRFADKSAAEAAVLAFRSANGFTANHGRPIDAAIAASKGKT